jgi:hypothetical protein
MARKSRVVAGDNQGDLGNLNRIRVRWSSVGVLRKQSGRPKDHHLQFRNTRSVNRRKNLPFAFFSA